MRTTLSASLCAALLVAGSATAGRATTLGMPHQVCTKDVKSLCGGIAGQEKIRACITSHMNNLSVACSDELSKRVSLVKECASDVSEFCGAIKSGHDAVAKCLKGHLHELSGPCKGELALMAAPDNAP